MCVFPRAGLSSFLHVPEPLACHPRGAATAQPSGPRRPLQHPLLGGGAGQRCSWLSAGDGGLWGEARGEAHDAAAPRDVTRRQKHAGRAHWEAVESQGHRQPHVLSRPAARPFCLRKQNASHSRPDSGDRTRRARPRARRLPLTRCGLRCHGASRRRERGSRLLRRPAKTRFPLIPESHRVRGRGATQPNTAQHSHTCAHAHTSARDLTCVTSVHTMTVAQKNKEHGAKRSPRYQRPTVTTGKQTS